MKDTLHFLAAKNSPRAPDHSYVESERLHLHVHVLCYQSLADTSPPVNGVETAERISVKKSVAVDDDQPGND